MKTKTKQSPMLFSDYMAKAAYDGLKTETRRIVKYNKFGANSVRMWQALDNTKTIGAGIDYIDGTSKFIPYKYGKQGDVIWIKESYFAYGYWTRNGLTKTGKVKVKFVDCTECSSYKYRYSNNPPAEVLKRKNGFGIIGYYKRNSLFMPKQASRTFLQIIDVSLEKLDEITAEAAINEGIIFYPNTESYHDYLETNADSLKNPKLSFMTLWESINGLGSWNENPLVFVTKFKKITF